jgi:hypothetical protein
MSRRTHLITTAALLAVCAAPASAATYEDMTDPAPPPSSLATQAEDEYQDLRSADARDAAEHRGLYETEQGPYVLDRDYGSPDAADAARDVPSAPAVVHAGPGPYTDSERKLVESPEVQQMLHRVSRQIAAVPPVVEVSSPSGGFNWGDAGIGAAGMLALFSIAGGSALLLAGRKRRRGVRVATR